MRDLADRARQIAHESGNFSDHLGLIPVLCDKIDNGAADNDGVSVLSNFSRLIRIRNAKPDCDRQIRMLSQFGNFLG